MRGRAMTDNNDSPYIETETVAGETLVKGSKLRPVDGLWPVERVNIPELAVLLWEQLNPGFDQSIANDGERDLYVAAVEKLLNAMVKAKNVSLYP